MKKKPNLGKNKNGIALLDKKRTSVAYISAAMDKTKKELILAIRAKTDGRCWYCGVHLRSSAFREWQLRGHVLTIDHQQPTSKGGSNEISNLVPCCVKCNSEKGSMTLDEYRFFKRGQPPFYGETWKYQVYMSKSLSWLNGIYGAANIYMGIGMLKKKKFRKMIGMEEDVLNNN